MTPNGFPRSRLALALAVAIPLAVLGDAVLVRSAERGTPFWQPLDDWWNDLVGGPSDGFRWQLAQLLDRVGGEPGLALVAIAAAGLLLVKRWRSALFVLAAVGASWLIVYLVKLVGGRARPDDLMVDATGWAFPSGHSARMAAFVVIVAAVAIPAGHLWAWWPVAVLLTLLMMAARTWQHAHWLTDTIAGAATGWAVAMLVWRLWTPLLDRERELRESADPAPFGDAADGVDSLSWTSTTPTTAEVPDVHARPSPGTAAAAAAVRPAVV